MTDDNDDI